MLLAPLEDLYAVHTDWTRIPPYTSVLLEEEANSKPLDAIEILLQTVGSFRKRQPKTDNQLDILENAAIIMNSALTYSTTNRQAFLEAQGVELVVRCLKERVHAGGVTLQWLDVPGTAHDVYQATCERMVQSKMLKYLFGLWMGKALPVQAVPAKRRSNSKKAVKAQRA